VGRENGLYKTNEMGERLHEREMIDRGGTADGSHANETRGKK